MNEDQEKAQIEEAQREESLEVPLKLSVPTGISRYAQHLIVQRSQFEVVLSFFEVVPPVLLGTPEEQKELLKNGVRADCVARIIVANNRYSDFVRAMSSILEQSSKEQE